MLDHRLDHITRHVHDPVYPYLFCPQVGERTLIGKGKMPVERHTTMPVCPKCKGQTYSLVVTVEEQTTSDVVEGVIQFMGQSALPQPVRAEATCQLCGHSWRIRNAKTAQLSNYE